MDLPPVRLNPQIKKFMELPPLGAEGEEEFIDPVLKQLITYVPDLVAYRKHNAPLPQTSHSYGVVMFADISGFTALCEKYCSGTRSKSDGVDQLTTTLNSYLSQLVQSILDAKGDILKFAGDALLAYWDCSRFTAEETLAHVLQKSLQMQTNYDNFESSDGDTLRMKLALSVGKAQLHYIGNNEYKTFDITGEAIDDVNQAQSVCSSGAVVISKAAWELCNKQQCSAEIIDSGCVQVISMIPEEEKSMATPPANNDKRRQSLIKSFKLSRTVDREDTKKINTLILPKEFSSRSVVKNVLPTMSLEAQQTMRHYILKTVVQKVEHGHEVSWLSELREVCVLFINLDPGKTLDAPATLSLLQTSFDVIYPCLTKFEGTLNKVFMFDKGCTFLCIFGLPHAKHEDEATRALRAARHIFHHLGELDIKQFSIGVTTGVAFCGVVGHPQRQEYTVIGQKVNMAARLMMKFPNTITCDETTRSKSSIPDSEFTVAPPVTLKGISKPENIYSFSHEITQTLHHYHSDMHLPTDMEDLIGRDREMGVFLEELLHVSEHTHRDPGVIILTGSGGMGKTRILRAMKAKAAAMGFRIVSGIGGLVEKNTPFFTVKTLITRLLELDNCKNIHEREQLLLQHITDDDMKQLLPLLNDILVMKFPQTQLTAHMTHDERTAARHKLLYSVVHQEALTKPCVFGIDDAHWIDHDSWSFLLDLALDPNAILVLTIRPLERIKDKHPAILEILNHPHTKVVKLEGLILDDMITLACRLLKVDEIPDMLQQIIRQRSHGVPLWCEELIETMLELNYLEIIDKDDIIDEEEEDEVESYVDIHSSGNSRRVVMKTKPRRSSTARLTSGLSIGDIPIPDSVAGMVLTRIDRLSPSGQMTIKCAAVIGTVFNKAMLEAIIPNCKQAVFHQSLNPLAEAGMIECAVSAQIREMHTDMDTRSNPNLPTDDSTLQCLCMRRRSPHSRPAPGHKQHIAVHPPVNECHTLQFVHTYIQETAYGLWTESQRKALHTSAAEFLESEAHKCTNCGGGGFIAGGSQRPSISGQAKKPSKRRGSGARAFVGAASMRNKLKRNAVASRRESVNSRSSVDANTPQNPMQASLRRRLTDPRPSISVPRPSISDPRPSISDPQPSISDPRPSISVPRPSISDPRPSISDPRPSISDPQPSISVPRTRFESICTSELISIDKQDCHCDEVLASVYPQLVCHWRATGNVHKTLYYLIEAGSAAVATFNNMEALSLLHEAMHEIVDVYGRDIISDSEYARLESLIAQALFQSGEIEECLPHFKRALRLLHTRLPEKKITTTFVLGYHAFKQFLHRKFPQRFIGSKSGRDSEMFLDQARCMTHVTHVYHLQHDNLKSLTMALKQLNVVEEAQEDIHELIEAYATVIECCQHFNFKRLASSYLAIAMSLCSDVQLGVEDMHTYAHLLCVGVNLRLCQGSIEEALEMGAASHQITSRMHDVTMDLASLPLLFYSQMTAFEVFKCKESLKQLNESAAEADDLRAQALHDCCEFDALLEFGVGLENALAPVRAAETCCEEDIYHFDDTERFFLISCLALWHARQSNGTAAESYQKTAQSLLPREFETYLEVRALSRFVECFLVLHKDNPSKVPSKPLTKMKTLCNKFIVFKPRYLLLSAYHSFCKKQFKKARTLVSAAIAEASKRGCKFDMKWAKACQAGWFGSSSSCEENHENIAYIFL